MDSLSNAHVTKLNNMSDIRDPAINLGTVLNNVITRLGKVGTPVNAVNAVKRLTLTGVVKDGETITVNNPLMSGVDVYEFLADELQTKTAPTNIAIDLRSVTVQATVTLTIAVKPTAGDQMTIGTKVYTFVPVGTANADGEISIGADVAAARVNIQAAINGTDGWNDPHPLVSVIGWDVANATIDALIRGTDGNSIASTETFTSGSNVFDTATLTGGLDCTAANACTAIIAAVTASDTQGVDATAGAGTSVDFTATVAGISGNDIVIGETLPNATFAGGATKLSGGVDGTVGYAGTALVDATYVYFCVDDNLVSGKNWRRVTLGNAF